MRKDTITFLLTVFGIPFILGTVWAFEREPVVSVEQVAVESPAIPETPVVVAKPAVVPAKKPAVLPVAVPAPVTVPVAPPVVTPTPTPAPVVAPAPKVVKKSRRTSAS